MKTTLRSMLLAGAILMTTTAYAHADYCDDLLSDLDTVWGMINDADCWPTGPEFGSPMCSSLWESIAGMTEDYESSCYPLPW